MNHRKFSQKMIVKIEQDDITTRHMIKNTLIQAKEAISIKETEVAEENMFDDRIKKYESILSHLRVILDEINTAVTSKEIFYRIAKKDEAIVDRIIALNVVMQSQANEFCAVARGDADIVNLNEKYEKLRNTFLERQNLFLNAKII